MNELQDGTYATYLVEQHFDDGKVFTGQPHSLNEAKKIIECLSGYGIKIKLIKKNITIESHYIELN